MKRFFICQNKTISAVCEEYCPHSNPHLIDPSDHLFLLKNINCTEWHFCSATNQTVKCIEFYETQKAANVGYKPFGKEWEKEMNKLTKKELIEFIRHHLKESKP